MRYYTYSLSIKIRILNELVKLEKGSTSLDVTKMLKIPLLFDQFKNEISAFLLLKGSEVLTSVFLRYCKSINYLVMNKLYNMM